MSRGGEVQAASVERGHTSLPDDRRQGRLDLFPEGDDRAGGPGRVRPFPGPLRHGKGNPVFLSSHGIPVPNAQDGIDSIVRFDFRNGRDGGQAIPAAAARALRVPGTAQAMPQRPDRCKSDY